MIQHCSRTWKPLGIAAGYKSAREAKANLERSYRGITSRWRKQKVAKRTAHAAYKRELREVSCSFCGRTPFEVQSMVVRNLRICNICVDSFYQAIHSKGA
ncbi:MAG: hypothetical protein KF822_12870 [Steroidobacteraceae bacterium]|nr:hypothetical protein [Steroidobacteraceae bacterium]